MRTFQGTVKVIIVLCISVMPAISYAEGWPSTLRSETIILAYQPHVAEMPDCPFAHDMRESKRTNDSDRTADPNGCDQHSCFLKCFHSKDISTNLVRSRAPPSDFRISDIFAPEPLYEPPTPLRDTQSPHPRLAADRLLQLPLRMAGRSLLQPRNRERFSEAGDAALITKL